MNKRLYVDMDGSIARFYEIKQYIEEMFEKGFFEKLRPYKRVILGLEKFQKKHPEVDVFVLSACVTSCSETEKNEWLDKYLPIPAEKRIFMKVGEKKAAFVPGGITDEDYLLDDYTKNLQEWEAAGGKGIKIRNELNCKSGKWTGFKTSAFNASDGIVSDLENALGLKDA